MAEGDDSKPMCRYGAECFRKNPQHALEYRHPEAAKVETTADGKPVRRSSRKRQLRRSPSEEFNKLVDDDLAPPRKKAKKEAVKKAGKKAPAKAAIKSESDADDDDATVNMDEEEPTKQEAEKKQKKPAAGKAVSTVGTWDKDGTLITHVPTAHADLHADKVAAFDLDWTLARPASGKVFAVGRKDWVWLYDCVTEKLQSLHAEGYRIVIFSNQKGIGVGKVRPADITGKLSDMAKECGVPFTCLLATEDDVYRKPSSGMWSHFVKKLNGGVKPTTAFYVGDMAGREKGFLPGRKRDRGCSDRKFAANNGLQFHTPDEFFLFSPVADFDWRGIDPRTIPHGGQPVADMSKAGPTGKQEVVLLVGYAASGKTSFAKEYFVANGYAHVNRDTLKTPAKCRSAAVAALEAGQSVVVDNTNPSPEARAPYVQLAESHGVEIRCFCFSASLELAKHLNEFREKWTKGERPHVPGVAYNIYKKKYVKPDVAEGFSEVIDVAFVRNHPSKAHEKMFDQFTERIR